MKNNTSILKLVLFLSLAFSMLFANAQTQPKPEYKKPLTRILFIFDDSYSMVTKWQSGRRIDIAKRLFDEMLDSLQGVKNLEVALRIFGHQSHFNEKDCNDTRLEVPFAVDNIPKIKSRMKWLEPKGNTPIASSLRKGALDFPKCDDCRNIIILITDGKEECSDDPCAVSLALQQNGVVLKPFIIGIGNDVTVKNAYECMGQYFDASDESTFKSLLNIVISQALNQTTAQINLLDINHKPTETNVPFTLLNHTSKKVMHNFVHTLNHKGNPDTLKLDHLVTYDLLVHTIPPVRKDSIKIIPGIHNIIGVDAPQGILSLKIKGNSEYKDLKCIIRKAGIGETLHVQDFDRLQKYIVGKYDLEILCLPRVKLTNIDISQNKTTTIELPQPGTVTCQMTSLGYGAIFQKTKQGLVFVCSLNENFTNQNIVLEPGSYVAVFRPKNSKETAYTINRDFEIISGVSLPLKLY